MTFFDGSRRGFRLRIHLTSQDLGRDRTTLQRWLRRYRRGISELLKPQVYWGRKPEIPQWAQQSLNKRLHSAEGFYSYGEIQEWLERTLGVSVSYKVVHRTVHYKRMAKLKQPLYLAQKIKI